VPEICWELRRPDSGSGCPRHSGKSQGSFTFQDFAILVALTFLLAGGSLLHDSISTPAIQPWELLSGALLCSLVLIVDVLCESNG
jgi:hypothetical protein